MVGKEVMEKHATNDASKTPMSFITRNFGTLSWGRLRALERKTNVALLLHEDTLYIGQTLVFPTALSHSMVR